MASPASNNHRKGHTKSRAGCNTCKKRKIKCDETRPSCRNCKRHSVECDFVSSNVQKTTISGSAEPFNLIDLELFHNFTSYTCNTLTNDPELRNAWRTTIIRKTLGCEYLMRALLAVSGVHLAQHRPEQRQLYESRSMQHYGIASRQARLLMSSSQPKHNEDLWIFSVMTVYYALGNPMHESSSVNGGDAVPNWVFLLRGVRQFVQSCEMHSEPGILSPFLERGRARWHSAHQPEHENANILFDLEDKIISAVGEQDVRAMLLEAIKELRCYISFVKSSSPRDLDVTDAFVWQYHMVETYLPLLEEQHQEATVVFAHGLIILNALDHNKWLHGWASFLMSKVWSSLDHQHRLWISWPIEEIGWMPPP